MDRNFTQASAFEAVLTAIESSEVVKKIGSSILIF